MLKSKTIQLHTHTKTICEDNWMKSITLWFYLNVYIEIKLHRHTYENYFHPYFELNWYLDNEFPVSVFYCKMFNKYDICVKTWTNKKWLSFAEAFPSKTIRNWIFAISKMIPEPHLKTPQFAHNSEIQKSAIDD